MVNRGGYGPTWMNYYDELGISPNAGTDEVREAYKQLARLLHPDLLQDPRQRSLAEIQMKRLNHIYHTLSNTELRREYDLSLTERILPAAQMVFVPDTDLLEQPLRRRPHHHHHHRHRHFGIGWLAVAALAGALVTYVGVKLNRVEPEPVEAASETAPQAATPASTSAPARSGATGPGLEPIIINLRSRLHQAEHDRDEAVARLHSMGKSASPAATSAAAAPVTTQPDPPPIAPVQIPPTSQPPPVQAIVPTLPPAAPSVQLKGWNGRWYYVRQTSGQAPPNMYPPEFIEAALLEDNGMVRGRYRARYKIADRAIPPEVDFQFAGKVHQGAMATNWQGPGGAKGDVRIRQLSTDTIELSWIATDLGRHQGLGYGTAILVRRHDP